jgi:hypothetical protein
MHTKTKETAMTQLLNQLREERNKLPLPIEWDRCYQAVEMMIESTYIPIEKEQIIKAVDSNFSYDNNDYPTLGELYYQEHYGK